MIMFPLLFDFMFYLDLIIASFFLINIVFLVPSQILTAPCSSLLIFSVPPFNLKTPVLQFHYFSLKLSFLETTSLQAFLLVYTFILVEHLFWWLPEKKANGKKILNPFRSEKKVICNCNSALSFNWQFEEKIPIFRLITIFLQNFEDIALLASGLAVEKANAIVFLILCKWPVFSLWECLGSSLYLYSLFLNFHNAISFKIHYFGFLVTSFNLKTPISQFWQLFLYCFFDNFFSFWNSY